MILDDKDLHAKIEPLAIHAFSGFDVAGIDVKSELDHDGDPIVRVTVSLQSAVKKYPPDVSFRFTRDVIGVLNELGDPRFPMVGIHYPNDEPAEDLYPERSIKRARRATQR